MGEELRAMRGRFHKTFRTAEPSERKTIIGAAPLHFKTPSGEWEDLANLVQQTANGWVAATAEATVGVVGGWLTFEYQGRSLRMRPVSIGMVDRTAPASRWRKLADADYTDVVRDGSTINVHNIFPQTDLKLTIEEGVVSKAFTVRQRPNLPDPVSLGWDPTKTYVVIVWDVEKPAGAVVKDAETGEVVASGYVGKNSLRIETSQGDAVAYLDKGEAVSASGVKGPVWFVCLGASIPFGEALSYQRFVNAPYPLVIDPTTRVYAASQNSVGYIADDVGTKTVYTPNDPRCGDDYSAGSDKPPVPAGGGPFRGFIRFDLSALTGTCTSAKLKGSNLLSDNIWSSTVTFKRVPDWGTLDTGDWNTTPDNASMATASHSGGASHPVQAVANDGSGTWMMWTQNYWQAPYTSHCYTSTNDGSTWTATGATFATSGNAVGFLGYVNGYWFLGIGGYLYRSSNGGASWTQVHQTNGYCLRVTYNGTVYLASYGANSSGYAHTFSSTTSDLNSWTDRSAYAGTANEITKSCWDGTYWWTGGGAYIARTSQANGSSLATVTPPTGMSAMHGLASDGNGTVVISCTVSGTTYKIYRYNAGSWVDEVTPTTYVRDIQYLNGRFVARAYDKIYVSTDGDTWTTISLSFPILTPSQYFSSRIGYYNGTWLLAPGDSGPLRFHKSTDNLSTFEDFGHLVSFSTSEVQGKFGSNLAIRAESNITTGYGNTWDGKAAAGSIGTYLEIITSSAAPAWVSPADGASTDDTTPTFTFTSTSQATAAHFNMQLDTANTFDTGSLRNLRTVTDQTGWEYWDGSAWQSMPSTGMPSAKTGNDVRYTPGSALSLGTWYRRVRQG